MYLQTPSLSKNLSTSANFFIPFPTEQHSKLVQSSILKYGFCITSKRVCRSGNGRRSHGDLIGIRCEGKDDGFYMRRCVELARKAIGCTSPNPMVGCVIVKDGKIVGEGFHPKAGQPHAEVMLQLLSFLFSTVCFYKYQKGGKNIIKLFMIANIYWLTK